jgi:hypothetical protein
MVSAIRADDLGGWSHQYREQVEDFWMSEIEPQLHLDGGEFLYGLRHE